MSSSVPLLRVSAISPLHFASPEGEARLARPTLCDAIDGLPVLPGSSLKGVLAGRLGDLGEEAGSNPRREAIWGAPDRPDHGLPAAANPPASRRGSPSSVVLGDGELLTFPVPTRRGAPVWTFPAATLARLFQRSGAEVPVGVASLLRDLERQPDKTGWLMMAGVPDLPEILAPVRLLPYAGQGWESLVSVVRHLAGETVPGGAPLAIVGSAGAAALWNAAAERRTLTALDSSKTVQDGALRRIELIPAASVFLLRPTGFDRAKVELGTVQVGAWEAQGAGWVKLDTVTLPNDWDDSGPGSTAVGSTPEPAVPRAAGSERAGVLYAARAAVRQLLDTAPEIRRAGRAAVYNFGPRARLQGLEAALGFTLARAKPALAAPKAEPIAQRWLFVSLIGVAADLPPDGSDAGPSRPLLEWLGREPFARHWPELHREPLMQRWLWLRRFVESELPPDEAVSQGATE